MATREEQHVEEEEPVKQAGKSHGKSTKSGATEEYNERMRNFNKELMEKVKGGASEEEEMPSAHSKTSKRAAASEEAEASE